MDIVIHVCLYCFDTVGWDVKKNVQSLTRNPADAEGLCDVTPIRKIIYFLTFKQVT